MPNRNAEDRVVAVLEEVMRKYHSRLVQAGVRVLLQTAHAPLDKEGKPKGPALKCHGVPAHAVASLIKEKFRKAGLPDCLIELDGDNMDEWSQERMIAILDHELAHFELCLDGEGQIKLDDCLRPRLKLRPHDEELGVLWDVAKRHGRAEPQVENFEHIQQGMSQLKL